MYLSTALITCFFDLSWKDDILNGNNKSALAAFAGGFLGAAAIYAAANIGDGPGWWCFLLASGVILGGFGGNVPVPQESRHYGYG